MSSGNRSAIEAAVFNEDNQRWGIDYELQAVEAAIARAQISFFNALATGIAARINLEVMEASLDAQRGRYQAGVGTVADLLEAQRDTLDAERELIAAEYDGLRGLVEYLSANDDLLLFRLQAHLRE